MNRRDLNTLAAVLAEENRRGYAQRFHQTQSGGPENE